MTSQQLHKALTVTVLLMALAIGCAAHTRHGWRTFNASGRFLMDLPEDMEFEGGHGFDSCVRHFRSQTMSLYFDYGYHLNAGGTGDDESEYSLVIDTVDGVEMQITTWQQLSDPPVELHYKLVMTSLGVWPWMGVSVSCKSPEDCAVAREVISSIRFPRKKEQKKLWGKEGWMN